MVTITISNTVIQTAANGISIMACLWLTKLYTSSSTHSLDSRMLTTLSLANLIYHITTIITLWFPSLFANFVTGTFSWSLLFSLCWSAHMAIIVNRSATRSGLPSSRGYANFLWLVLPSLLFSIIWKVLERKFSFPTYLAQAIYTIAIVIIVVCYIRTLYVIKELSVPVKSSLKSRIKLLGLYPLIEAIALGLLIFDNDMAAVTNNKFQGLLPVFAKILAGLTGAAIGLIYWLQKRSKLGDLEAGLFV